MRAGVGVNINRPAILIPKLCYFTLYCSYFTVLPKLKLFYARLCMCIALLLFHIIPTTSSLDLYRKFPWGKLSCSDEHHGKTQTRTVHAMSTYPGPRTRFVSPLYKWNFLQIFLKFGTKIPFCNFLNKSVGQRTKQFFFWFVGGGVSNILVFGRP